jgi:hypothetical protein
LDGRFGRKEKESKKSHTQIMHTFKTNKHNYTFDITFLMAALRYFVYNITTLLYVASMSITDSKI